MSKQCTFVDAESRRRCLAFHNHDGECLFVGEIVPPVAAPKPRHEIEAEKAAKPRPDLLPAAMLAIGSATNKNVSAAFAEFADYIARRDAAALGAAAGNILVEAVSAGVAATPAAVLMAAGEIMSVGLRKHGPCTWRIAGTEQADPQTHYASAVRHILEHLDGVTADPDSGRHPLLHAVCQIAIMINLLDDPPDYPDDNDGRAMIGRPR